MKLHGPSCFILCPHIKQRIEIPRAAEIAHLEFDLMERQPFDLLDVDQLPREKRLKADKLSAVFGTDKGMVELPDSMLHYTKNVVQECCETSWRNERYYGYANAQLTLWFKQWQLYFLDKQQEEDHIYREDEQWLDQLERKLRLHISYGPTCEQLAQWAHLSHAQFYRIYTKARNKTPGQLILECKMNEASHLLKYTDLSIGSVSRKSGYRSPKTFSAQFKKHFKRSPKDYRQEVRRQVLG